MRMASSTDRESIEFLEIKSEPNTYQEEPVDVLSCVETTFEPSAESDGTTPEFVKVKCELGNDDDFLPETTVESLSDTESNAGYSEENPDNTSSRELAVNLSDVDSETTLPEYVGELIGTVINPLRPYQCTLCNSTFRMKTHLRDHARIHSGVRPFKCNECGRSFVQKSQLKHHVRIHSGIKPYKCQECEKSFARKESWDSHILIHTGEMKFFCDTCGLSFARRDGIQRHVLTHTGIKPYRCVDCGKKFANTQGLRKHILANQTPDGPHSSAGCGNPNASKPRLHIQKSCPFCQRTFRESSHLTSHIRSHTGERPYKCETCEKSFVQIGHLNSHKKLHTGERPFVCLTCGDSFVQKHHLHWHTQKNNCKKVLKLRNIEKSCIKVESSDVDMVEHKNIVDNG